MFYQNTLNNEITNLLFKWRDLKRQNSNILKLVTNYLQSNCISKSVCLENEN